MKRLALLLLLLLAGCRTCPPPAGRTLDELIADNRLPPAYRQQLWQERYKLRGTIIEGVKP